MANPFAQEQYRDPSARLRQLSAQRRANRDARGIEVYESAYGWIGVTRSGGMSIVSFYKKCPCSG